MCNLPGEEGLYVGRTRRKFRSIWRCWSRRWRGVNVKGYMYVTFQEDVKHRQNGYGEESVCMLQRGKGQYSKMVIARRNGKEIFRLIIIYAISSSLPHHTKCEQTEISQDLLDLPSQRSLFFVLYFVYAVGLARWWLPSYVPSVRYWCIASASRARCFMPTFSFPCPFAFALIFQ